MTNNQKNRFGTIVEQQIFGLNLIKENRPNELSDYLERRKKELLDMGLKEYGKENENELRKIIDSKLNHIYLGESR